MRQSSFSIPETPGDAVRNVVFLLVDTDVLAAAVERVGELAEPHDDTYFSELRKFNRKIAYTPDLLTGLDLGAAPAGRPLLEAIEYLRVVRQMVQTLPSNAWKSWKNRQA